MSIWSNVKGMGTALLSSLLPGKAVEAAKVEEAKSAPRTIVVRKGETAEVRAELESAGYVVEEAKDIPAPKMPRFFERMLKPQRLRGHGYVQGETFDVGINKAKRAINAITDKRERKAARSRFIKRLRESGIKN